MAIGRHAVGRVVLVARLPTVVEEAQPKRLTSHLNRCARGAEPIAIAAGRELRVGRPRPAVAHSIRVVAAKLRRPREAHPDHTGRGHGTAHRSPLTAVFYPLADR